MTLYKVVVETEVKFKKIYEIEARDEEDIRHQLDVRMNANPYDFIDSQDFEIGEYDLEDMEVRGVENG